MNFFRAIAEAMYAFKPGFSTVYSLIGTIVSLLLFYKTIYIIIGALCTRKFEPAKSFHKYGIVIAARNEKNVIGNLLESIEKQDYPLEYVTVFVVADNCTDDGETARIAREHGAVVYERFDREHATKGFALQFLFQNIEKDYGTQSFEGFFVFDADNLLKSDFISRMNDAFDSGEKIITSFRNSKNFDENWIAASYAMHWLRSSRQSHRARSVFRLATNIQGTGFLFASEIVKNGWKYTSLTEDRALTADAVVQGYQISYNDAAEFYDEQPTSLKIALRQRLRWAKGHIMAFSESGWGLFKNIFTYKGKNFWDTVRQRFASFDMLFLVVPRPLFILAKKILKAIVFLISYTLSPHFWVLAAYYFLNDLRYKVKSWLTNMLVPIYVYVFDSKRIKKISLMDKVKFVFTWPLFDIIGKYSMYVALFKRVEWKPIPHDSKVRIDDVAKPREIFVPAFLRNGDKNAYVRFMAHCSLAAVSLFYSFFMLGFNPTIFAVFMAVNLILLGLHVLVETKKNPPHILSQLLLMLTFIWNIAISCEVLGNGAIQYMLSMRLLLNLLLYALPFMLFYAVLNSVRISAIVSSVFWLITSSANYFLTEMRGRPLFLSDLFSIGTGLNVVSEYKFDLTAFYIMTLLYIAAVIAYIIILEKTRQPGYYKQRWFIRVPLNIVVIALLVLSMTSSAFLSAMGVSPYFWSHKVNGFPLNFVMDMQYSRLSTPDGYLPGLVTAADRTYRTQDDITEINAYDRQARPNVLVIMNESFSDLRVIGDFDTNIDVTPFIDNLCEDPSVISGYSYVSVFGGGTADSEYEFLTGDSMFIYSQGAVPYQTNFKNVSFMPGIVSTFNAMGYRTIATHPYYSSGWNRPAVYSAMGFDEQRYIESYNDAKYLRSYVSDESDFDDLISLYEERTASEPLFIFNVTMQNHGGYKSSYRNFNQQIELRNTQKKYPLAEQYLSLLHETDHAVQKLITYLDSIDDPTVVVFFGDHQVQVEEEFYAELYGKSTDELTEDELMQKYATRFFIWSNFDMNTPDGFAYLSELERSLRSEPVVSSDDANNSDAALSDAASSDTVSSDVTTSDDSVQAGRTSVYVEPVKDGRYDEIIAAEKARLEAEEKAKLEAEAALNGSYNAASDSASPDAASSSDSIGSDADGSDVTASDGELAESYVTQKRIQSTQIVTSLSHLSGILFEAAGLPTSSYQNYLKELRKTFPVLTVFGAYTRDGAYNTIDEIRDDLRMYSYYIYNHIFDKNERVESFFTLSHDDFDIHDSLVYMYANRLEKWMQDKDSASEWLRNVRDIVGDIKDKKEN